MKFAAFLGAAAIIGMAALSPFSAMADDHAHGIHVKHAYAFATSDVQKNGAAFFKIKNKGETADRLIGASADVSEVVELHTHAMDGGIMMMREVEGYDVPADGYRLFEPMGDHIMLIGLHSKLEEGTSFPLTLTFEHAGEKTIEVTVNAPGVKPEALKGDHKHGHDHKHHHGHAH